MRKVLVLVAIAILATSCVTTFQPEGFGGGFTDNPLGNNQYRIDVRGNGFTGMQRVKDIAMVRSAEIALENGKEYFIITSSSTDKDTKYFSDSSGNINSVKNYYFGIVITLTDDASGIKARSVIDNLGTKVGYLKK